MNQSFNSKELIRYLKKGELIRNNLIKDVVVSEIDTLNQSILNETFEFNIRDSGDFYFLDNISEKLIMRKLNDNIKRIYKDEQANRKFIIQQVKALLEEDSPFWIIKTDIKSFYESIDREWIFKKLKDDAMLSYYSIFLIKKIFKNTLVNNITGLPRGLNVSATMSEIYMRRFDKWIKGHVGVYFYARFVDDIIIFISNKDHAINLYNNLENKLKDLCALEVNNNKTELIDGFNFKIINAKSNKKTIDNNIEYLGYKFFLESFNKKRILNVSIADKKVNKIKTRVIKSFLDYRKNNDFSLLEKRIKFITGNYGISKNDDGSILKAGIYFNYLHVNNEYVLSGLNFFLRKIIFSKRKSFGHALYPILSVAQKDILKKYCFKAGFKNKTYNSFKYSEMKQIIKCW
ncbi:antiviral reverse transcriptase Drt3a [Chryseobacterium gambrini]|uniref:antiviral reverse transcriptase Drt3a n=1 Tax=Chryseobacterium gambrini TaxID=373672 RepID=UPI003D13D5A1